MCLVLFQLADAAIASTVADADTEYGMSLKASMESETKKSQARAVEREKATDLGLRLKEARSVLGTLRWRSEKSPNIKCPTVEKSSYLKICPNHFV